MILDHMGFAVRDRWRSKAFYVKALAPLGIAIVMEGHGWVGMGRDGRPQFWFGGAEGGAGPIHLAFAARSRAEVRAFYEAALGAGGKDNGPPWPQARIPRRLLRRLRARSGRAQYRGVCHSPER
jgi:catechol 2,3-dioxygenase-like lactoylglutathione lyase family enzyme